MQDYIEKRVPEIATYMPESEVRCAKPPQFTKSASDGTYESNKMERFIWALY